MQISWKAQKQRGSLAVVWALFCPPTKLPDISSCRAEARR